MRLQIDSSHLLVRLTHVLDWDLMEAIAEDCRLSNVKSARGPRPHYRANLGAVIVRSLKSCNLRETEDLCRNYMPARYMCDLQNSEWTPDHDTIWEFEVMLGEEGLSQITRHVLKTAEANGFLNIKGLASDTTVQEGRIPYPNEVGLMGSFARSIGKHIETAKRLTAGFAGKIRTQVKEIKTKVREHRLFAKTKEARLKVASQMSRMTRELMETLLDMTSKAQPAKARGTEKNALNQITQVTATMTNLIDQIDHWLTTGWVHPQKIVALFQDELRAIKRGKAGKSVEFGIKWGINQIRGGYVCLFTMKNMMAYDADYAVRAIEVHEELFGRVPKEFAFDRGAWSQPHLDKIKQTGVTRMAVAPRGQSKWLVSKACRERTQPERAQVEGKIGTLKQYGMNKPKERTTEGARRAARRAELRFNLTRLAKDLASMWQTSEPVIV